MRKEIEKYIEELRTEAQKDRLIYVETNDEFYLEKLFNITNVYTRLQSILDYYEEKNQINLDHFDIHTVAIVKGHNHKSHNWHTFSPSVNYKSDWQRVNEAEADQIEDSMNDYEILRSRIKKTGGKYIIESIRRLSDGEVFSIGDFISDQYGDKKGIIRAFRTDYAPDVIATDMELETDSAFISLIDAKKVQ